MHHLFYGIFIQWQSLQCQVSQHSILVTDNTQSEIALLEGITLNLYKPSNKKPLPKN